MAWVNRAIIPAITQIWQIYLSLVSQIEWDGGRLKSYDGHMSYGKVKGNDLKGMPFISWKVLAEKWNTGGGGKKKSCVSGALPAPRDFLMQACLSSSGATASLQLWLVHLLSDTPFCSEITLLITTPCIPLSTDYILLPSKQIFWSSILPPNVPQHLPYRCSKHR